MFSCGKSMIAVSYQLRNLRKPRWSMAGPEMSWFSSAFLGLWGNRRSFPRAITRGLNANLKVVLRTILVCLFRRECSYDCQIRLRMLQNACKSAHVSTFRPEETFEGRSLTLFPAFTKRYLQAQNKHLSFRTLRNS